MHGVADLSAALSAPVREVAGGPLLEVRDLTVEFLTRRGIVTAVEKVNLTLAKGETLGIVGESGSGKSVTSYTVMRILDRAGRIAEGSITFSGLDVAHAPESAMRDLRGREMSMIFQNPRAALNPIRKVGHQIADVLLQHVQADRSNVKAKVIEILEQVRIARPQERYHAYPFELSGGMCQRIVIALALACRPQLMIADEPTTGLDVTTQKAVMDLVTELTRARGMSTILITHDLGLAAAYCDTVMVMEKGKVVETAPAERIFRDPQHPYTKKLMRATPRPGITLKDLLPEDEPGSAAAPLPAPSAEPLTPSPSPARGAGSAPSAAAAVTEPLLKVENLLKEYPRQGAPSGLIARLKGKAVPEEDAIFRAVDGISFEIRRGESVGLVGESGCGKSTTSSMVMRLLDPTAGKITFAGEDISAIPARDFAGHPMRRRIQMVFQDPTESLNPRYTAARAIADPLIRMGKVGGGAKLREEVEQLARMAGLPLNLLDRFPHQLSGGQKARIGIARAIALRPDLVILDEPTAALDVSVQAVVLNLLDELKHTLGMSYLFVSHDLHVVGLLCDRVIVMRQGRIVEEGGAQEILESPKAAYTRELISAIPHPPV
ncbi:dipeptide ABC transporter ATP-binding protein [Xanthobacter tagetidis]|uniref:ABC transporter ATP-binding protein n=1 Tax=Xanthobacter tagetidis TaxID=60216 RepID=A0A3L7AA06_9HYPH|nr:ABC transporter ATP-binding protein [Xanthobacter tagetidis]MBB6309569.1 peptide/nickel transport system ATP-binding protein [Xanthobacter tagetidis]RLP77123.1 ABC transporter ATP-binding protein [Xanthobacter tagetidis]